MRDLWRAQGARLCLGAILLLALALRLYRLDAQSLWNDEGTSVALAGRDLATITRSAAADIHPPLYYYLLHAWTGLWGTGEAAARSLSALAGVGVVAATYALGRRTLGAGAGLAAALLAAVSPFGVYYAQEARMYVLATLLGALSMLAYVRLLAGWAAPSTGRRATLLAPGAYLLATVAAVYTHYFAYSLLAAQNVALVLWLAWRYRAGARRGLGRAAAHWAGLQAAVVALYVPWLIVSRGSLAAWPAVSEPLTLPFLAREALRVMALGVTAEGGRAALLAAAPALAALAGAVHGLRRGERAVAGGVGLALLYAAVPVLVIYVLSLSRPMYKSNSCSWPRRATISCWARGWPYSPGEWPRRSAGRRPHPSRPGSSRWARSSPSSRRSTRSTPTRAPSATTTAASCATSRPPPAPRTPS